MITLSITTAFFGWASVINIAILLFSTVMLIFTRETVSEIHSKLFGVDKKDLGRAYFQYLAQYKIAIIVFNVTPYLALRVIG